MSRRAEKKEATRTALAQAAARLFLERGFEATTVEDVAIAAGVSRRTFFRYFPSKEAAFFAESEARFETFVELVDARREALGAWASVWTALRELTAGYERDREGALVWQQAMHASSALESYDLRVDMQYEAHIRDVLILDGMGTVEASAVAGAVMGAVRAGLRAWFDDGAQADLVALSLRTQRLLEGGVARRGGDPEFSAGT